MKYYTILILLMHVQFAFCQGPGLKRLEELINTEEPGWELVEEWMKDANNKVEVLERDAIQADSALYRTQVTTRSPMGAIVYETGGILIDNGWIRILGSGSAKLERDLPEWNKGRTFEDYGHSISLLLVADDAIGGFFAINGGAFGSSDLGKIYYFSPSSMEWEALGIGYSQFIYWTFTAELDEFYEGLRWNDWKTEVGKMSTDSAMHFFPFLWTKYDSIEDLSRKEIPIEEIWSLHMQN